MKYFWTCLKKEFSFTLTIKEFCQKKSLSKKKIFPKFLQNIFGQFYFYIYIYIILPIQFPLEKRDFFFLKYLTNKIYLKNITSFIKGKKKEEEKKFQI